MISTQHSPVNRLAALASTPMGSPSSRVTNRAPLSTATPSSSAWEGRTPRFMARWMASTSTAGSVSMGMGSGRSL